MNKPIILLISGPAATGKTTFSKYASDEITNIY
jgi:uridine kinase